MRAYQRMPTPTMESRTARRFQTLLCFHRKSSSLSENDEALERFVGREVEGEGHVEESKNEEQQPNKKKFIFGGRKVEEDNQVVVEEASKNEEQQQPNGKKKFFSLPKNFPKFRASKAKPSTTTTTKSSTEDSDTEPTTPPVIESKTDPLPPPPPPAPVLTKERSYDSSRSGKSGQVTKMTTPNTPPSPPKESLFFKKGICMEESSTVSVDEYSSNSKELMPVTSIDTFISKSKSKKKKKDRHQQPEDDEGSMISVLTMDPVLQAISRREAEMGITHSPPKQKKKASSGSTRSAHDNAMWEATMMSMTNPYCNPSIAEGDHEDDGSDALSEIAPLDLVSL